MPFEYKNFMSFPNDIGKRKHNYWEDLFDQNIPIIEFYLVDSFEIMHMIPIYEKFLEKGFNARFVAEPCEINTSSTWFDYDNAIKVLDHNGLRYVTKANPNAEIAFSTQKSNCLRKYNKLKVNVAYGAGVYKKGFGYTDGPIKGFDFCLVNGMFMRDVYLKHISKDKVLVMGYPKHKSFFNSHLSRNNLLKELGINTDKQIVVYYPTWDENSSILKYAESISKLRDKYYVITKAHHCTWHLKEKKDDLEILKKISDYMLDKNYDIAKSTLLGDFALSDLKSGATTEIPYFNSDIKQIILSTVVKYEEDYRDEVKLIGPIVTDSQKLISAFNSDFSKYLASRRSVMDSFFGDRNTDYVDDIVERLIEGSHQKK